MTNAELDLPPLPDGWAWRVDPSHSYFRVVLMRLGTRRRWWGGKRSAWLHVDQAHASGDSETEIAEAAAGLAYRHIEIGRRFVIGGDAPS